MSLPRTVSLLPSATELVCAVGGKEALVGVSHECDHPAGVESLPVLTGSRIDATASSREIDTAVRAVIRDALSVYTVDDEQLRSLRPELIVTQDLCEVCAVSLDDVQAAVSRFAHGSEVRILSLRPTRLDDILDDIVRVGEGLGLSSQALEVKRKLRGRIDAIAQRSAELDARPRVVSIEWVDPIMLGGTWMPELITHAGGLPVGVSAGDPAPTIDAEALEALAPDVVLVKPCGYSLGRAMEEREVLERHVLAPLGGRARVFVTDGNAYFNRPGPRIVESLEIMAACVHPDAFSDFGQTHADAIVRVA